MSVAKSKEAFVAKAGGSYGYKGRTKWQIDEMRMNEFPQLSGRVYLDHAGATIYSKTQLNAVFQELQGTLFANPHSALGGDEVESTTARIDRVRSQVLNFFSASEHEYTLIFTSGATAALKLVGESFPWTSKSTFAHSMDSHTSVLGIRGYAAAHGSSVKCVGLNELEDLEKVKTANKQILSSTASNSPAKHSTTCSTSLFAYPAECNFSGVRHSLELVHPIRAGRWKNGSHKTKPTTRWLVLVDAAKYAGTHQLDLSRNNPDFVVLSFYKMFGYPTGLGALIARKEALSLLTRVYQGGGTIQNILAGQNYALPLGQDHKAGASSRFADGTPSFLSILALRHGFSQISKLGMTNISAHTEVLRMWLVDKLTDMKHWNGRLVCEIYGSYSTDRQPARQGPIVACNFRRSDGSYIGYYEVQKLADIHGIHLRTGCFCNPGACQHYLNLKDSDLLASFAAGHVCGDNIDVVNNLPTGAVRLSLGYMTTFEDVHSFVEFVLTYFVCKTATADVTPILKPPLSPIASESPHLCKLTLYPIKSCAGMTVETWPVGSRGLLFDREFAIVEASTGNALTLKVLPDLCFLHPIIDLERKTLTITYCKSNNDESLHSPASQLSSKVSLNTSFTISLRVDTSTAKQQSSDNPRSMRICSGTCKGCDVDSEVSRWLSSWLGRQCALVRVSTSYLRVSHTSLQKTLPTLPQQNSKTWDPEVPNIATREARTIGFANQAQYLLISRQSIAHFDTKLSAIDRALHINEDAFRANLIVDGCLEPFEEDTWKRVRIGRTTFDVSGPCSRCSIINLDPHSGVFHRQPLQVLSTYRRQRSSIYFGQFLIADASREETRWLSVGDKVEVVNMALQ
ncbi:molybdenum cofactor sulfurase [Plasmopara halstedii]|uniref:Molybdenum cofactor sulfurase n=1 Tax=Plasmopara halstedii TaxID=4781 RepID=A0A0P1APX8_PLAHL|nr:molybdenum cofactor sulfurase [Plasmopara halstedii]CEG43365.1 molybdenum cofactor sulfurase [Plasmopara halstedii]|eukprot:XP_024579734.1 molybdenum cofactor sulfurase [Plasmopara halstedii]